MAEYIEREALLYEIGKMAIVPDGLYDYGIIAGVDAVRKKVSDAPAADVAPVVRCKDCKHYDKRSDYCERMGFSCLPDDFCSYGEKKDGDDNG